MPLGAGSLCSANSSWWRNGSSTASAICSIWLVEAADVVVGDVGHLLEHQLLDLGPGQLLEQQPGAGVHQHGVAGAHELAHEGVGQLGHPLLVGPADDDGPRAVVEHLLDGDDLAGRSSGVRASTTLSDSLSTTSAPRVSSSASRSGWTATRILRPPESTSTVPSSLLAEQGAVGGRRLGELVDLLAEGGDVLARLAEGVGQLLVLARPPGPAGPWSRAGAPRGCGPAWGRPGAAGGGRGPPPRGRAPARAARRRSSSGVTSSPSSLCWSMGTTSSICRCCRAPGGGRRPIEGPGRTLHRGSPDSASAITPVPQPSREFLPGLPCLSRGS